ncbi:MAG: TlpA family protein disulfide reductase [Gammaproteobacteria bacterium]|nr:TlpA family protein disulfide reductase [Gammaproteobacteria bacterium]
MFRNSPNRFPRRVQQWLLILLVTLGAATVRAEPGMNTLDGKPMSLNALSEPGTWTVVMFWSTTCHICDIEIPKYSVLDQTEGSNIKVKGVALDGTRNVANVRRYIRDHSVTFDNYVTDPLQMRAEYEAAASESILGTPTFWLYSPEGKLVGINPGPLKIASLKKFIARKSAR